MAGFAAPSISKMGNLIVNPGSSTAGALVRTAFEPKIDQGTYVTGLRVTGEVGVSGAAPSGVAEYRYLRQLRTNMTYLWTNVGSPSGVTRTAQMVWEDGTTTNFSAQFRLTRVAQKGPEASLMLDVIVPAGRVT
jgi:alpha-L-fucosidase